MMTVGERFLYLLRLFVVLLVLYLNHAASTLNSSRVVRCIEKEREALLLFKQGLVDDYGRLSSWGSTEDCCKWSGIKCSNRTNQVIMLDLHALSSNSYEPLRGLELEYGGRNLGLLKSIDLSSNRLSGEIPREIGSLIELIALNLSRNNLSGQITPTIGELKMLESLDLSKNRLFGELPTSFSNLNFLSFLDLSNNTLSGRIPTSTQLQGFNASTYMGNLDLCGPPLPKCPGDETAQDPSTTGGSEDANIQEEEDRLITPGFYVGMALGFIIGFWGVCGSLFIIRSWRYAYFHFVNNMTNWLYVKIALNMARLQGRLGG